jgi:hypothetical protein
MDQLEDLVRFETANSGLAFREHAYRADERADLLRDLIALANATVTGPRFLFVGIADTPGGERRIVGLSAEEWSDFRDRLAASVSGMIEPAPNLAARALELDGALVGMLCLTACADPPYLLSASAASELPAGRGWVRRGTNVVPLLRADLKRMFEAKTASTASAFALEVGFAGDTPQNEITLPVLELDALPSAVAAAKIRKLLEAQQDAKTVLGRTATGLSRLMHAQLFGVDRPYVSHSEDSLRAQIGRTADEHRAADEHYTYELRAHRVNFVVRNAGDKQLDDVTMHIKVPRVDAMGIADRVFAATGAAESADYPLVKSGAHGFEIEGQIEALAAGDARQVFRQPPRLWARAGAAGKTLPIAVTVHARELREPLRETLILRLVAPSR